MDDDEQQGLKGRLGSIPCYRLSLITGITSGIVGGLGAFMATSNAPKATKIAIGVYAGATLVSWGWCRYKYAKAEMAHREIKEAMKYKVLLEGTELGDKIEASSKDL